MIPLFPYLLHNLSPRPTLNSCSILNLTNAPFTLSPFTVNDSLGGFLCFLFVLLIKLVRGGNLSSPTFEYTSISTILPPGLFLIYWPANISVDSSSSKPMICSTSPIVFLNRGCPFSIS